MPGLYTEADYENSVVELFKNMGYTYVYGPDIERDFKSPLYDDVLVDSLHRINKGLTEDAITDALYKLKNFGITGKESVEYVGGNAKLNEFCAIMGICNLRHVDQWIDMRRDVYLQYKALLGDVPGVRLLSEPSNVRFNYAYMPVIFEEGMSARDRIYDGLCAEGIYPRKYFYPCINAFACYRGQMDPDDTPVAKRMSESVLTLPIYPELPLSEVERICSVLKRLL